MNRFDVRYMQLVEEKLKAIINKKATVTDVARALSVQRQTIYTWKARYERFGIDRLLTKRKKRTDTPAQQDLTRDHTTGDQYGRHVLA